MNRSARTAAIHATAAAVMLAAAMLGAVDVAEASSRGERGDGRGVVEGSGYPVEWSADDKVAWRVPLGGHGSSAPIVADEAVVILASNEQGTQRTLFCFDRTDGDLRWRRSFTTDDPAPPPGGNGYAGSTPVTDGETVYASLGELGVVALAMEDGEVRWHREDGPADGAWGGTSGLRLHEQTLFLHHHPEQGPHLLAMREQTGETVWHRRIDGAAGESTGRPATLVLRRSPLGTELIVAAAGRLAAFNPVTGRPFWHCRGLGRTGLTAPMLGADHAAAADGDGGVFVMRLPDAATGDVTASDRLWRRRGNGTPREAAGLIAGEWLFLADAEGNLECVALDTGEVLWRENLGTAVHSDLMAAEGRLYVTDRDGTTHVIRATDHFDRLRTNTLAEGDHVTATAAFSSGQIFLRTTNHLYCIGVRQ